MRGWGEGVGEESRWSEWIEKGVEGGGLIGWVERVVEDGSRDWMIKCVKGRTVDRVY